MPYEEFLNWQIFYQLEPWGWHDREYRTASLLAMLLNVHTDKEHRKGTSVFYRDMLEMIENAYEEYERELDMREAYKSANAKEKAELIKRSLGV